MQLPNLSIENFRGIRSLSIPRLGYVTLITGENSAGKTTLLDAIRTYCARGRSQTLQNILLARDEFYEVNGGSESEAVLFGERPRHLYGRDVQIDWSALFYGRDVSSMPQIKIGPSDRSRVLQISASRLGDSDYELEEEVEDDLCILQCKFGSRAYVLPRTAFDPGYGPTRHVNIASRRVSSREVKRNVPTAVKHEFFGPDRITNEDLSGLSDRVALSEGEDHAVQALNLVLSSDVNGVRMIGDRVRYSRFSRRRMIVKINGHPRPIPLKSMGDGAVRMVGLAMALAVAENGFVLLDEVENGIHHSIQAPFWRMVFKLARESNTQVIATTHSWDCVVGFSAAMEDQDDAAGGLVRIDRYGDSVEAVTYTRDNLQAVATQGIEVR